MKSFSVPFCLIAISLIFAGGCAFQKAQHEETGNNQKRSDVLEVTSTPTTKQEVTISPSEIDISKWKTYKDEALGIELKLPEIWNLASRSDKDIKFISKRSSLGSIEFLTKKTTSTIEEIKEIRATEYMGSVYDQMKPAELAGMKGYRVMATYGPSSFTMNGYLYFDQYLLQGDGVYYEVLFSTGSSTYSGIEQDIEDWKMILGTISRY